MNKKFMVSALSSVLALSALTGCGNGGPKVSENTLRLGMTGFDGVFNPILSESVYDAYVCDLIFEGLITNDPAGNPVGKLASSWDVNENVYTFTLQDGIQFSDGTPLTAEDVAFTYNTVKEDDYAGPRVDVAAAIDKIEVLDEKNIKFTMTEASPVNIWYFTYGILSKDYYAHSNYDELLTLNNKPMGSGPLVFDSWASKQYINLLKNEKYWDASNAVQIDGVLFQEVSEEGVLAALQNGEIDVCMPAAKAENLNAIEAMDNSHLVSYLGNGYTFMCFNTTRPTLNDAKVRQALMYALDRQSFLKAEYGSDQLVALGMCPISPTSWAYPDTSELNAYNFDLEKAAALLDEAGCVDTDGDGVREMNGEPMNLHWLVYNDNTWPGTLANMAFDSWGKIGVHVDIDTMDFQTVKTMTMDPEPGEKDFDIYTMGFSLAIDPDPTGGLFDADAYKKGGFNASGFRDEESQNLMKEGFKEFDQEKRKEIYKEWVIRQNELLPTVIIAYRSEIWGINNRVHGLDDIGVFTGFPQLISNVTIDLVKSEGK